MGQWLGKRSLAFRIVFWWVIAAGAAWIAFASGAWWEWFIVLALLCFPFSAAERRRGRAWVSRRFGSSQH